MSPYEVELIAPASAEIEGIDPGGTATVQVAQDQFVLAAARAQGVWLPADCQQGWCTTCAAELLDGEIDQSAAIRYFAVDQEADLVLLCTAKPRSDLRLRIDQHEAMLAHRAEHDLPPGRAK